MAKMKRARQKFHIASQKKKKEEEAKSGDVEMSENTSDKMLPPLDPTAGVPNGEDLFKGVNISELSLIKQKLPDFDARSSITSKTFKGQNLKKKDKLQMRKEAWMSKMDAIQSAKKKEKERKKKQKTVIVGDLTPMADALPTLELLLKSGSTTKEKQSKEKPRSVPKEKKRKKQMLDDISIFHRVHQHPRFKEDATSTVNNHLRYKMQEEQEMNS